MDDLLWSLLIGLVAGWLAEKITKKHSMGGASFGGFLFGLFGLSAYGLIGSLVTALVGAVVLSYLVDMLKKALWH